MLKCCLCGCDIYDYGNNPEGAAYRDYDGEIVFPDFEEGSRCCDDCNEKYVIPGRIYAMWALSKENKDA